MFRLRSVVGAVGLGKTGKRSLEWLLQGLSMSDPRMAGEHKKKKRKHKILFCWKTTMRLRYMKMDKTLDRFFGHKLQHGTASEPRSGT